MLPGDWQFLGFIVIGGTAALLIVKAAEWFSRKARNITSCWVKRMACTSLRWARQQTAADTCSCRFQKHWISCFGNWIWKATLLAF